MTMPRVSFTRVSAVVALAFTAVACADKALMRPTNAAFGPKMALQVTTVGSQVSTTPRYIWVGAGAVIAGKDTGLLAMTNALVTGGTQNVTLNVDLAPCFAANAANGNSGCSIIIGAALRADTISVADTAHIDPFKRVFDYTIIGPFDVSTGRAPTLPAIDLSASRFTVLDWVGDEALRLGGAQNITNSPGSTGRVLAGAVGSTGSPVLYSVSLGVVAATGSTNSPPSYYPALSVFENGAWRRVIATAAGTINPGASNLQGFTDVTALATSEVYIAATGGLYKYDGSAIARVATVTDALVSVASGISAGTRYVIAGGNSGVTWIGNTQTWQRYVAPTSSPLDGVCITGPNEAFASSTSSGQVFRFNGTSWTNISIPNAGGAKVDLQCPAAGLVYVIVSGTGGGMFRWTGTGWTQLPSTGMGPGRAIRWSVVSASEIYAVGDSAGVDRAFYRFDGSQWSQIGRKSYTQAPVKVWADPRGGSAYALSAFGRLEKFSTNASVLSYMPALRDAVMTSPTSAFAVGWNLFLARWNGSQWTIDPPPSGTPAIRILQGVWSDGPKNAWAVGNSSTILHYDGSTWSVVSDQIRPIAAADNYNAVWGSGTDVWAVGDGSILHCKATNACAVESSGASILYGIWGSSSSNIIAVGAGGRILRYNGSSWSAMTSPTSRALARVAGSGPSDVWAVGDSVLIHYDGTSWTSTPLTGDLQWMRTAVPSQLQGVFQIGLGVRSPKEVYLGADNGQIFRYDGTGWREATNGGNYLRRVLAITGASGCAFAVTEGQTDSPQPTILRGIGTNGCMASPMLPPLSWP